MTCCFTVLRVGGTVGHRVLNAREAGRSRLIDHGVSGLIVTSVDEAIEAVRQVRRIDRRAARGVFETRFTASRMAADYIETFQNLLQDRKRPQSLPQIASPLLHSLQRDSHNNVEFEAAAHQSQPA